MLNAKCGNGLILLEKSICSRSTSIFNEMSNNVNFNFIGTQKSSHQKHDKLCYVFVMFALFYYKIYISSTHNYFGQNIYKIDVIDDNNAGERKREREKYNEVS